MVMYDMNLASPTVADDMILISFSAVGLNCMLDICYNYAMKWKFSYNANKCSVMTFNGLNHSPRFGFNIGDSDVPVDKFYTHLGIKCDAFLNNSANIDDACIKLRGTFLSIINSGVHPEALNPLTSKTIYDTIVIPRSLYGCELWTNISHTDRLKLEISHRFVLKYIQSLHRNTNTDFALFTLCSVPLETIIDYKKLQFLGQLCRLPNKYLAKQVFNQRLIRYNNFDHQTAGFVPEIYRLVVKYGLNDVLERYVRTGLFLEKYIWKNTIKLYIIRRVNSDQLQRMCERNTSECVQNCLRELNPISIWSTARHSPQLTPLCKTAINAIGSIVSSNYNRRCSLCNLVTTELTVHRICLCTNTNLARRRLWNDILTIVGISTFQEMLPLTPKEYTFKVLCLAVTVHGDELKYGCSFLRNVCSMLT